jgi:F-type H+-transporting ATPase subunit delta
VKAVSTGAARRYARALLDVSLEKKADAGRLRAALDAAAQTLVAHADLRQVLAHPAVAVEKKKAIVEKLFGGEPELLRRLLNLLVARDRILLLPRVAELYAALYNAQRNVIAAEAVSAVALTDAQQKALAESIKKTTGKDVELTTRVDPALVGGVRVSMAGRVYDGSVRAQLAAMRQHLVAGSAHS